MAKIVHSGEFWKPEACGQTVLPDRSLFKEQKMVENAQISNATFWVIFKHCVGVIGMNQNNFYEKNWCHKKFENSKAEVVCFTVLYALRHRSQHVGFNVQKWQQVEWNFSARLYPFQVFRKHQSCVNFSTWCFDALGWKWPRISIEANRLELWNVLSLAKDIAFWKTNVAWGFCLRQNLPLWTVGFNLLKSILGIMSSPIWLVYFTHQKIHACLEAHKNYFISFAF